MHGTGKSVASERLESTDLIHAAGAMSPKNSVCGPEIWLACVVPCSAAEKKERAHDGKRAKEKVESKIKGQRTAGTLPKSPG